MNNGTIHIIGAGLAGLEAATNLAARGRNVVVYEAAAQAGGRCRSYYDTALEMMLDNGNHLLLSGNHNALAYLERIGAKNKFAEITKPVFDFADAKSKQRWRLDMNAGILPLWLFNKQRRVPQTKPGDYFSIIKLLKADEQQVITDILSPESILYRNLWHPLLLSALNTHPAIASAKLAAAIIKNTLLKGGKACIPLVAEHLTETFIQPALNFLNVRQIPVHFNRRLNSISFNGQRAATLEFTSGEAVHLAADDSLICAVAPANITTLLPGTTLPDEWRGILNAHFRVLPPANSPKLLGVVNGLSEWIFCFPDRVSVTISDADRLMDEKREVLAENIWQEVAALTGLPTELPPWQIVKEKRATFAATPAQNVKRPGVKTAWQNVFLAGDWTQTGLPATIEGAVYSGKMAANMTMAA